MNQSQSQSAADGSRWFGEDAPKLILNYLVYHCHQHTAAAFVKEWLGDQKSCDLVYNSSEWRSLDYRSRLTDLIRSGRMEESLEYIDEFFPHTVQSHDGLENPLRFAMQCQQFVEMIKKGDTAGALQYAEQQLAPISTQHPDYDSQLQKVIVLLAYADPMSAPCRFLLEQSEREELAAQVNAAILGYPRPLLNDAVLQAAMHAILQDANGGVPGPKRTERHLADALASRSLTDLVSNM